MHTTMQRLCKFEENYPSKLPFRNFKNLWKILLHYTLKNSLFGQIFKEQLSKNFDHA